VYYRAALLAACLAALSCSRRAPGPGFERIAILRFENLSSDDSIDWMGRAFSEIISRELAAAPGLYAIPFERLHSLDASFGNRPPGAPGISAERGLAMAAGATRLGYGEYTVLAGRLQAQLTIEDLPTGKVTSVISASAAANNPVDAASALARQISSRATPYLTRSSAALSAYVSALESQDFAVRGQRLQEAMAADPGFAPPYYLLAQALIQRRDRAGALALFDQALSRGAAMPELERARIAFEAATVRGDNAGAQKSLAAWARLAPNDPVVWRFAGQAAMNRHDFAQSVAAYQKGLAVEPEDASVLNQLGYAAAYAGDLDTATRALQRYGALRPADVNPLDSLGDVNLLLGRLREAENFYLQAVKKDPAFQGGGEFFKAAVARLMTGDVNGADALAKQFLDARAAAKDPLADFHKAQWAWISGRRKGAYDQLAAFARAAETGPPEAAAQAYSQLALWSVALGNRSDAALMAQKAVTLARPASAAWAAVARFVAQPSASAAEWSARAGRSFPDPAQKSLRDSALAYALLADKDFQAASLVLKPMYDATNPTADDSLAVLLAWAYIETGKPKEAAALLRFNPVPAATGVKPFAVFYFPRLFYLRGRIAALAGNRDQAQAQFRLFRQLSGDEPLLWGEEEGAAR
jgi:Flp pilus assembly protein TadD